MSFWDVVWFIIISFAFIAYLMILFQIVTDLFRDRDESGWMKAVWIVCLIFLPLLTALVYLIARGPKMAERQNRAMADYQAQQEAYIRNVATQSGGPADQIAKAKQLLDDGHITQADYDRIKEKALS
ncbi:MAG TPA: PLD nuclease N-terminal domain-containing protein [Nocardioides sp.]|jgi:ABC-type multidrug transport system fused ATPase/permease subunit|nr:PLD nuclease N-terminal domain-containing protein [Nocardioides sp.]HEX3295650.1 PLD nuclease N-terminal domain-containing protein [Nocardioides sp.]